jgi:DNA-binding transcriptional MocR family regulator
MAGRPTAARWKPRQCCSRVLTKLSEGHKRGAVARHIRRQGLPATSDQALIVSGAQHGLAVTAVALLQPGDVVAVDALSYPGFKMVAKAHCLEMVPLPITADRPDLGALAGSAMCSASGTRHLYDANPA